VSFNDQRLGVKVEEGIIDIRAALKKHPNQEVEADMMDVINGGDTILHKLETYIHTLSKTDNSYVIKEDKMDWGPAVTRPRKIICVGLNYKKHADETKAPYPEVPIIFNKFDNALTGHQSEITVP